MAASAWAGLRRSSVWCRSGRAAAALRMNDVDVVRHNLLAGRGSAKG